MPHCGKYTKLISRGVKPSIIFGCLAAIAVMVGVAALSDYSERMRLEAAEQARKKAAEQRLQETIMTFNAAAYEAAQARRERIIERNAVMEQRRRHAEILAEMRDANWLANEALWDRRLEPTRNTPTFPPTEFVPLSPINNDGYWKWQQQQTLEGIRWEVQQMRINQEFSDSHRMIQQSFQPNVYP